MMRCDNGTLDTRFYRPLSVTSARYSHAVQITALLKKETTLTDPERQDVIVLLTLLLHPSFNLSDITALVRTLGTDLWEDTEFSVRGVCFACGRS